MAARKKEQMTRHWIYGLAHPMTGRVHYVGETCDLRKRFACHLAEAGRQARLTSNGCTSFSPKAKDGWIIDLRQQELIPSLFVFQETTRTESLSDERTWADFLSTNDHPVLNRGGRQDVPSPRNRLRAHGINMQLLALVKLAADSFRRIGETSPEIAAVAEHFDKHLAEVELTPF